MKIFILKHILKLVGIKIEADGDKIKIDLSSLPKETQDKVLENIKKELSTGRLVIDENSSKHLNITI